MGQSLVQNYIHIIFSTKFRAPLISQDVETELHAYIGGICNGLESQVIAVGGYTDHIHILCKLSKNKTLAELVQKIKANSSKWMKTKHISLKNFSWQNGYGAFSVRPNEVEGLVSYIKNQHNHHAKKDFKEEYHELLNEHKVEYNEKYVWE